MRTPRLLAIVGLLLLLPVGAGANVGWMIYPYNLAQKDEDWQRLLNCKEAEYVGVQWFPSTKYDPNDLQRQRARELAAQGRKLIVDLWFGSDQPWTWRYFNFPNIALDPKIRQEFFDKCTDPFLDFYGAKNLYAVHLMEETGMQFGWDADEVGYPDEQVGYNNTNSYDNPASFEWPRGISGPNVLSIRKYNDLLRKETGLDMRFAPIWSSTDTARFNRWVQQTMEAGAHIQFAKHVHQKYPGLKVYSFNMGAALVPQGKVLDGQFIDHYANTTSVYCSLRNFRATMRPEEDLIAMTWGNRDKPVHQRLPQQAAAYLAGSDVLSTYGDTELGSDEWLNTVRDSVKPFLGLPRFESRPQVLYLGGSFIASATMNWGVFWTTGFASYDVSQSYSGGLADGQTMEQPLDPYKLVFNWAAGRPDLEAWVRNGGILVGVLSGADLMIKDGLLEDLHQREQWKGDYTPDPWIQQNLHLRPSYALDLQIMEKFTVKDETRLHHDQLLYVAPCGKGLVVLINGIWYTHPPWQPEPGMENYRQLLTDVCRGALTYRGLPEVADECFDDPALGNDYMKMTLSDGKLTVYVLLNDTWGQAKSATSFVVKGHDRVTGQDDVTFGEEHPVVMIEHG